MRKKEKKEKMYFFPDHQLRCYPSCTFVTGQNSENEQVHKPSSLKSKKNKSVVFQKDPA